MEAPGRGLPCPAERGADRCVQVRHADDQAHVARLGRRVTLYINIMPVRARVLRDDRCIFPAVRRASEARGGKEEGLMELRHPLSGDMAVVKSAPRCKSSFNRCAVALPLVMSHAPSTRQSAVTRSPQKVVWPQRAHLRRHHHHGAEPPRVRGG